MSSDPPLAAYYYQSVSDGVQLDAEQFHYGRILPFSGKEYDTLVRETLQPHLLPTQLSSYSELNMNIQEDYGKTVSAGSSNAFETSINALPSSSKSPAFNTSFGLTMGSEAAPITTPKANTMYPVQIDSEVAQRVVAPYSPEPGGDGLPHAQGNEFGITREATSPTLVKTSKCTYCGKLFARKYDCQRHERIHTGEMKYRCEVCGTGFTRSDYIKRHRGTDTCEPL
ncbi:hypothetical protein M0805_007095 [Coniferiporia weirii]|nr:hypothetical protein M0805_007095 [Coniferiporia weirii]